MTTRSPYLTWLANLQKGDMVVPVINGDRKEAVPITSVAATSVAIGKYRQRVSYRRKDGLICGKRPLRHLFRIEQP